ncbi:CHAT domain-containing protein [Streptomyces sp. NPDC005890]|uniref:CHAT domain-containing protein n=1 Tax=Streptomyces sp. NPDC005890 TaxID=3154568 RepID=UPI0033EE8BAA
MGSEVRRDEDGAGAAERQRELAEVLDEVHRLWHTATGEELPGAWGPVLDRLGRVEAALAEHGEDFRLVFVVRGLVLGMRCHSRREHASSDSDSADRAEALRRLRWTDRHAPTADQLAVHARVILVFLLVPWAVPRADGAPTVLRDALLTAGHKEGLLTESLRRDLEEAQEVVGRIAAAPLDARFRQQTANVKRVIERMQAPGADWADPSADTQAPAPEAGATDTAASGQDGDDPDDPEEALLDAVRGLVTLAGARSTAQFTRLVLRELCDWAWPAVMEPVLSAARTLPSAQGPPDRPPRLVLVPCGRLGVVPWHAARTDRADGQGHRYACEEAVISYAPSGTQFLAAAGRRRTAPADGPQVLVADPELTLPWAVVEAEARRAACYPGALRYGEFLGTEEEPDAAGTPAELLAVLPGGRSPASVVHLACHARAAPRPTDSALRLAGAPGADEETGRLTVAGILEGAADVPPDSAGPLVVLSACETNVSTRDHDEALTLATALVTSGAADVVGSRWAVRDGPTAVMMAVFHYHLTAGGLAPPDALRAAQLSMLDPHRSLPFPLDGPLRHEATRSDLHHVHHWAAFTHQGNPAPSGRGTGHRQQRHR